MAADGEVKVNIKINATGNGGKEATAQVEKVRSSLKSMLGVVDSVRGAVGKLMNLFGIFGMAMQGVQFVIEGFKKLKEWANRAAKAAAEMRLASVFKDASSSMDDLIRKQETYNRLLQQELGDLARRKELAQIEQSGEDEAERVKRETIRTVERAQVTDPKERLALEARYRLEDERRERAKRDSSLNSSIDEQFELSAIYGSKATAAEGAADDASEAARRLQAEKRRMNAEQQAEADKQIEALKAREKALRQSAAAYRDEEKQADSRRKLFEKQRLANRSAPSLAAARNEAERVKFEREEEQKRRAEEVKSATTANEFVRGYQADLAASNRERIQSLSSFAGGLSSADAVSQNRLTALGLGSGVSASGAVANDVHKLVDLLKQQIEATKNISSSPSLQEGLFTD